MQELNNTTANSINLTKMCKTSKANTATKISGGDRFADSALKFQGLELNIKVFFTFLSDICD